MIKIETKYLGAPDKISVSTSPMCATPLHVFTTSFSFFPGVGDTFFGDKFFHVLLLWCVIPLSIISLSIGYKKHKDRFVGTLGVA